MTSTTRIVIENNLVTIEERSVSDAVPLADYLPLIERRNPVVMPVLPTGSRAVWWDPTDLARQKLMVLIEREPFIANISFSGGHIHRVQLPYSRFLFTASTSDPNNPLMWAINDYRVFWSNRRYSSPAQRDMIAAQLPNVYQDGRICFGSTAAQANQTIADRLDQTVNEFFISNFNTDLGTPFPNGWSRWNQWEEQTVSDPSAWANWTDWARPSRGAQQSFDDAISNMRQGLAGRDAHVAAPDPIPALVIGASFGRTSEWLASLTNTQRARLWLAVTQEQTEEPARYTAEPEPEATGA